jgi:hypothetical protein
LFSVSGSSTFRERVRALWRLIKRKVVELNLFETEASWDDHHRRRYEITTTRLYILLLALAVIILVVYTAITVQTQSFTVKNLSQSKFEDLVSNPRYSPTLDCPCQNISIPYKSFIQISFQYHQLCSSDFVVQNSLWINLVYYRSKLLDYSYDDYRHFVVPHFRLLFHLCTLANDTLTDALSTFRSNTLINKRAQSRQAVVAQMEASVNQFRSSVPQTFMRKLDFIRQMAQGNGLVSSISSNWYPIPLEGKPFMAMTPRSYGDNNCSCGTNSMCSSPAAIDGCIVPGFRVGCYPLESLLQSTLECLYDMTCINKLKKTNQFSNMTIRLLNSTLSPPNVTVQSLIDALMVDRWETSITYEYYYAACAPLSCTYVIREQANPIYMITTIIGFCGGLTVALDVIVPVLMKIARYLIMCRRRRVEPSVAVIA